MERGQINMYYETIFNRNLNKIDYYHLSTERIANHFAENGYDFLYVYKKGIFFNVIKFSDFLSGKLFENNNKKFIQHFTKFKNLLEVDAFFEDNPEVERLVLIDSKDVVCEFNPLIELPLQNNVAKNLMALRYVKFFRNEIVQYLSTFSKILVIARKYTASFIVELLPEIKFDFVDKLKENEVDNKFSDSDLILDFYYGKKLRKILNFNFEVKDFCVIVEKIAITKLINYCAKNDVTLKFYKLQHYEGLNCLHPLESENLKNRKNFSQLLSDQNYIDKFATNDFERDYIRKRRFFCSPRLDNGYCFTQTDCQTEGLIVTNGLRNSFEDFNKDCIIHFYGPCTTFGILTPDSETVTSYLNEMFRKVNYDCSAINHGGLHGNNVLNSVMSALNTPVKKGDMLILLDVLNDFPNDFYPNLIEINDWFNSKKKKSDLMFFDFPGHCNSAANKIIAEGIFEDLNLQSIKKFQNKEKFTWFSSNINKFITINEFLFTNSICVKHKA